MMTQMGQTGFRWWVGTVIDNSGDPLQLGRVRVRVRGVDDLKTDDQINQWATCLTPTTSPSLNGVGDTPNLLNGSEVLGFFADGNRGEVRVVIGSIPQQSGDINTNALPERSRGQNTSIFSKLHPIEPDSAFAAEYSKNRVIRTTKGHIIELDDTDGSERVNITHASGTMIEMAPDGRLTIRNPGDSFSVTGGVKNIAVTGDVNIEVGSNLNAVVKGNVSVAAAGDISIQSQGVLRLAGVLGVQIITGGGLGIQAPAGVNINRGSLNVSGNIIAGTGATGSFIAGGNVVRVRGGIVTGIN